MIYIYCTIYISHISHIAAAQKASLGAAAAASSLHPHLLSQFQLCGSSPVPLGHWPGKCNAIAHSLESSRYF